MLNGLSAGVESAIHHGMPPALATSANEHIGRRFKIKMFHLTHISMRYEIAGGDALQVKDRKQHLQVLRAPYIGRQDRRREADALRAIGVHPAIAHPRLTLGDGPDARPHLALGQMPMANDTVTAIIDLVARMLGEELDDLRLDGLRQQRARAVPQHLRKRILRMLLTESTW